MSDLESIINGTEAAAAAKLAAKPEIMVVQGVPNLVMPEHWRKEDLSHLLPAPLRKSGTIILHDVDSFIRVAKAQGSLANCNIYLDVDYAKNHIKAVAVFNDHGETEAGWRDHRAEFRPRLSDEWTHWSTGNKKPMPQVNFAEMLEAHISDIAEPRESEKLPTGSDVLGFVTTLQETRTFKYGSGVTLQNGLVQLEFIEDNDTATKGKLELFREFALGIKPFAHGDAYRLKAHLRYRIDRNSGALTFWYELQRPEKVLEDAAKSMVERITQETGMPVIYGTP